MKKKSALIAGLIVCTVMSGVPALAATTTAIQPEAYGEKERKGSYTNETARTAEYHSSGSYELDGYLHAADDWDTFIIVGDGTSASVKVSMQQDIEIAIYD